MGPATRNARAATDRRVPKSSFAQSRKVDRSIAIEVGRASRRCGLERVQGRGKLNHDVGEWCYLRATLFERGAIAVRVRAIVRKLGDASP
jgi:hypothetical protein